MPALIVVATLLCAASFNCLARATPSDEKPNIVIFFADDVSLLVARNGCNENIQCVHAIMYGVVWDF